ncbi:MAG: Clp protease N-terminal domain-containing protein [Acidimicrobiales bacterium]
MFERFTDRARRVVVLAQEEARLLNHNYIGTEHILLGLIHEEKASRRKRSSRCRSRWRPYGARSRTSSVRVARRRRATSPSPACQEGARTVAA